MDEQESVVRIFRSAAEQIPPVTVSYAEIIGRAAARGRRLTAAWSAAFAVVIIAALGLQSLSLEPARDVPIGRGEGPSIGSEVAEPGMRAERDPLEVAQHWVQAIRDGRLRAAWKLLGPATKSSYGSRRFFSDEARLFRDGVGMWADAAREDWYRVPIVSSGEGTVSAVTVAGTLPDGSKGTHTFLVRETPHGALIETASGGDGSAFIEPKHPSGLPGPMSLDSTGATSLQAIDRRPTFTAEVAAQAQRVAFALPSLGSTAQDGAVRPTGRYAAASWTPREPLPPGVHAVVMFVEHRDGGVAATSALFEVRG